MDTQSPPPAMKKTPLLISTVVVLAAAGLIVVTAVLPAEFNRDPLGVGKLTGIARLWAPAEKTVGDEGVVKRARYYDVPFRSDVVEIPLTGPGGGKTGPQLEYKVHMAKDATLLYAWAVVDPKERDVIRYDFHGHTTPPPGSAETMEVSTWKQAYGNAGQGALTAPFDGIQGWQFINTTDEPVVVRVRLSGFYTLVKPGDPGNEEGILANLPAAQSRPGLTAARP